jgi:hypothetical protein
MDRVTNYYGQIPLETDLLKTNQNTMVAIAKIAEAILGTSIALDGLAVTPTSPASLNVLVGAGQIFALENLEATVWSSLPSDISHSIVKQGIALDAQTFGITPPVTTGYSQVFLVEVQYADLDAGSTVLPYYNSANPAAAFSGPGNSGTAQNTVRRGIVATQIKAGTAATTGTQVAPTADAGWTGIYTVTVANGATTITSGNISVLATAPFINPKLPAVPAGVQSGKWLFGVDTGSADAMVVALNPAPAALVPGLCVRVKKGSSPNATTTPTLNVGLGANTVKRSGGAACAAADIPANSVCDYAWDGSAWQMVNFQGFSATSTTVNNYTLTIPYAVDSGTANNVVAVFSPAITSMAAGDLYKVKLAHPISGASTITVNALTAVALVRPDGSPTRGSEGVAGQEMILEFDGTNMQFVSANLTPSVSQVAGTSIDLAGSAPGSTKTATWSAAEMVVETALAGFSYKGASLSLSFNGSLSGAGGMDTGVMPTSADLNIYAIYNPTGNTWSTLGTIACNGRVYSGSSMPSGYTASALIWSGKTDSAASLVAFVQVGRKVSISPAVVFSFPYGSAGWTAQSLASMCPANTKFISGSMLYGTIDALSPWVSPTASNIGGIAGSCNATIVGNQTDGMQFSDLPVVTTQTVYWSTGSSGTATAVYMYISNYTI